MPTLKIKVKKHKLSEGRYTFTVNLPLQCSACGHRFRREVQVGIDNPIVPCPLCYSRNFLNVRWHVKKEPITEGDVAKVVVW